MALIPLKIPAGFYRTGTELDASGRWRDGSLVRWRDGSLRPVGGWRVNENIASITTNAPRSMHTWESNNGTRYVAAGSYNELFAVVSGGTAYDIKPTNLTVGAEDAAVNIGYGYGFYGSGTYGTPRPDTGNLVEATTWSLDNWGEYLVACSTADGKLYEWDLQTVATEQITDGDFSDAIFGSYNFVNWTNTNNAFIVNFGGFLSGGTAQNPSDDQIASTTGTVGSLSQTITTVAGATYTIQFNQVSVTAPVDATLTVTGNATLLSETITDYDAGGFGTVVTYEFTADSTSAVVSFNATSTSSNFDISLVSVVKTSFPAQQISNAPIDNLGLIVTEERFIFALGAGANPRKVQWCDREDNTTWTPAATNEAGDIELQTSGQIETAIRTRGQTLIITDVDAHTARYIGPPYVYGFERVGTSCGIISRQAAADVDMGVFWMGNGGFFRFDGNLVSEIPCDVHDYVFDDINTSQKSKTWAFTNGQYGEIWWFYCSSNSTEIDRYVALDYKENHWIIGELSRTSGASRGVFEYPMLMGQDGAMYDHEVGLSYVDTQTLAVTVSGGVFYVDGVIAPQITLKRGYTYIFDQSDSTNANHPIAFRESDDTSYTDGVTTTGTAGTDGKTTFIVPSDAPSALKYYCTVHGNSMGNSINIVNDTGVFAESGPISIGNGDNVMQITDLIPDEKTQGDVNIKFKSRFYPNSAETTHGPYTPSSPTAVRFSGRQIRMRVEGDAPYAAWRVGTMRVDAKAGGRR